MASKKYDYSKYPTENVFYDYDTLKNKDFFGIHIINGRLEIDVDRYIQACKLVEIDDFIPDEFETNFMHKLFVPKKANRHDYFSLIIKDGINRFKNDWVNESKNYTNLDFNGRLFCGGTLVLEKNYK